VRRRSLGDAIELKIFYVPQEAGTETGTLRSSKRSRWGSGCRSCRRRSGKDGVLRERGRELRVVALGGGKHGKIKPEEGFRERREKPRWVKRKVSRSISGDA